MLTRPALAAINPTPRALPEPTGNEVTTYPNASVKRVDFSTPQIPAEYSFFAKYTSATYSRPFGCNGFLEDVIKNDENLVDDAKGEDQYYQNRAIKILTKAPSEYGDFGMWYYNVGTFNDRSVDMKVIIKNFAYETNHTQRLGAIAFDVKSIGIMLSCIDWVQVRYEYYYHNGSDTPTEQANIKGYNTLGDIDDTQAVCFDTTVKQMYVDTSNDNLRWVAFEGKNYIYGKAGQIDSTPVKGLLSWTFEGSTQTYTYRSSVMQHYTHESNATSLAQAKKLHLSPHFYKGRTYFLYEAQGVPVIIPEGTVKVIKKDKDTGAILDDAEFTLYKWNGSSYVSNGKLDFLSLGTNKYYLKKGLSPGKYKVSETKPPAGYLYETSPWSQEFTVSDQDSGTHDFSYEVPNTKTNPKISISKLANKTTGVTLVDGRYQGTKKPGWYEMGEKVTYKMIVRNYGNVAAKNLKVVDTMTDNLKNAVESLDAQFSIPTGIKTEKGNPVTITKDSNTELTIDQLAIGDSVTFDFIVSIKKTDIPVLEKLQNIVKVTGTYTNGPDTKPIPEDEDDTDEDKINITNPKLSISKLADKTTGVTLIDGRYQGEKISGWYDYGEKVTYKMIVRNYGNVAAKNLKVVDTMTDNLKNAVESLDAQFSIPTGIKTEKGNPVTITKDSNTELTIDQLAIGDSVTFDFIVSIKKTDIPVLEKLQNIVKVTGEYTTPENPDQPIPEDEDDTDEDDINICDPKISVSKLADKTTGATVVDGRYQGEKVSGWYDYGDVVTYKIIVRNYGNVEARLLKVSDTMTDDLKNAVEIESVKFVIPSEIKTELGKDVSVTVDENNQVIIDKLDKMDSVEFSFQVTLKKENIPALEKLKNIVKVTGEYVPPVGPEPEPDPKPIPEDDDDEDEDKINICDPKLSVSKLADKTTGVTLVEGRYQGEKQSGWYDYNEEVTYKIIVRNYGNVEAQNLKVLDTMTDDLKNAAELSSAQFVILQGTKTKLGKDVSVVVDKYNEVTIDRLAAGDSVTIDFKVTLKKEAIPVLEKLKNIVKVTGEYVPPVDPDPNPDPKPIPEDEDDTDDDDINVANSKVSVSKLADKTTGVTLVEGRYQGEKQSGMYYAGDQVIYKIIVRNYGNVTAKNLLVTDTMSEQLKEAVIEAEAKFVIPDSIKSEKGNPVAISQNSDAQITVDKLAAGDSISIDFIVTLKESGIEALKNLDNLVTVFGDYETPGNPDKPIPEDEDDKDNDKIDVFYGYVEIIKTSSYSGKKLEGAVFGIYTKDGEKVDEIKTDKKGYAKSGYLYQKTGYYLKEITAPDGFKLSSKKHSFKVKESGEVVRLSIKNDPKPGEITPKTSNPTPSSGVVKTGDNTNIIIYLVLAIGAILLVGGILLSKRRKN